MSAPPNQEQQQQPQQVIQGPFTQFQFSENEKYFDEYYCNTCQSVKTLSELASCQSQFHKHETLFSKSLRETQEINKDLEMYCNYHYRILTALGELKQKYAALQLPIQKKAKAFELLRKVLDDPEVPDGTPYTDQQIREMYANDQIDTERSKLDNKIADLGQAVKEILASKIRVSNLTQTKDQSANTIFCINEFLAFFNINENQDLSTNHNSFSQLLNQSYEDEGNSMFRSSNHSSSQKQGPNQPSDQQILPLNSQQQDQIVPESSQNINANYESQENAHSNALQNFQDNAGLHLKEEDDGIASNNTLHPTAMNQNKENQAENFNDNASRSVSSTSSKSSRRKKLNYTMNRWSLYGQRLSQLFKRGTKEFDYLSKLKISSRDSLLSCLKTNLNDGQEMKEMKEYMTKCFLEALKDENCWNSYSKLSTTRQFLEKIKPNIISLVEIIAQDHSKLEDSGNPFNDL